MKNVFAAVCAVLLLVSLAALLAAGSRGGSASAAAQYRRPALSLAATNVAFGGFTFHVVGSGYSDPQPGGHLQLTCTKGTSTCDPLPPPDSADNPWPSGPVNPVDGSFSFDYRFQCPSNVKSGQAFDVNGVKSSPVKAAC